ncbi:MAG: histidine phosphatase family protein [Cytophagales bacterium]|nr:histidine phosphatase family protein [Cytophagales bacterium]
MSTKTIYLIRHGQTDYNLRGIVQGSGIDADLNELGRAQASAFYEMYKTLPFEAIYTSALKRTHQSVEKFLEWPIPHNILPGLNEISWGHKEGKVPNNEDDKRYFDIITRWRKGETHIPVEGGESPEQVAARQMEAMKVILSKKEEKLVLVAMHGRAMRILLAQLSNLPLSEMDCFMHQNLCLYKLEYSYTKEKFSIIETNNVDHLAQIMV